MTRCVCQIDVYKVLYNLFFANQMFLTCYVNYPNLPRKILTCYEKSILVSFDCIYIVKTRKQ